MMTATLATPLRMLYHIPAITEEIPEHLYITARPQWAHQHQGMRNEDNITKTMSLNTDQSGSLKSIRLETLQNVVVNFFT